MAFDPERFVRWKGDLLPNVVDRLGRERADDAYGLWPVASGSYEDGFYTVTYAELANVVNGLARWLAEQLGTGPGCDGAAEVLTYIGPNDVRLTALIVAAVKTGHVVSAPLAVVKPNHFRARPRCPAAQIHLLGKLRCGTLITPVPTPPASLAILESTGVRQLVLPDVKELLTTTYPPYVYGKSFEAGRWDPVWVIHSSGSTGMPKPKPWAWETLLRQYKCVSVDPPPHVLSIDGFCQGKRVFSTLPAFHGAGLMMYLANAIPFGTVVIVPPAGAIPTAQSLADALEKTKIDYAVLVPSVVLELAQDDALLDFCARRLELILYIGGDLPQAIGDRVAAKVKLRCWWGATEVGIPHQLIPPELGPLDWRYIRFHACVGAVFEEVADGVFELCIRRDEALADTQMCFTIGMGEQAQLAEYRTGDLFERHPTVADAWCWRARSDDIIVFLNGEKTNPISFEQHVVARNPELGGALVIGTRRFQAALLVEPAAAVVDAKTLSTAEEAVLIERIWPSVQEANAVAPAHARVEKSLILVIPADRPLIRAGKGTVQRPASIAQYTAEIERLYENANVTVDEKVGSVHLDPTDAQAVANFIRDTVRGLLGAKAIDDTASFFEHGVDSLQALGIVRALRHGLYRPDIGVSTVYQNPSVSQLTAAIVTPEDSINDGDIMASLLATYRKLMQQIKPPTSLDLPGAGTTTDVILTGSTGTLGTLLLRALLDRPGTGHVFCLNRSLDGGRGRFADDDSLVDRVTFLQADLARPLLGLHQDTYNRLRDRVGLVVHNAWPVNFNHALLAFRPQLAGLVNLFALSAAAAPRTMSIVFISSVSAVGGRPVEAGPAPETVFESLDTPYANGYARSKFLSEVLCDAAARHLGIPVAIARLGQMAGSAEKAGLWNPTEWLPSLVVSSLHLGCLPESLGPHFSEVDWVPSDVLAEVVVDLAGHVSVSSPNQPHHQAVVFNVRNPHTTAWQALLPAIREAAATPLAVVDPSDWLARLQASAVETQDLAAAVGTNPALKLLDFYRDGLWGPVPLRAAPMVVDAACHASPALRALKPVGPEWMRKWVDEWLAVRAVAGQE